MKIRTIEPIAPKPAWSKQAANDKTVSEKLVNPVIPQELAERLLDVEV